MFPWSYNIHSFLFSHFHLITWKHCTNISKCQLIFSWLVIYEWLPIFNWIHLLFLGSIHFSSPQGLRILLLYFQFNFASVDVAGELVMVIIWTAIASICPKITANFEKYPQSIDRQTCPIHWGNPVMALLKTDKFKPIPIDFIMTWFAQDI